jgi:hypothetical protein
MAKQPAQSRMVTAVSLRAWLLWLSAHYDPQQDTPENREIRRLGLILEQLGQYAGAIDTSGEKFGGGACLLESFDWERGLIEFWSPPLLTNRLGAADPEALISRLIAVTGIPEQTPPEPDYVL